MFVFNYYDDKWRHFKKAEKEESFCAIGAEL